MQVTDKPNVVLFLDIDGVLGPSRYSSDYVLRFKEMVEKLLNGDIHVHASRKRCNVCSTAHAHLFKKEVVQSLEDVISKIEAVANVHIVISSMWRQGRTVEKLKQIFHMHEFSKYIIDKTVDDKLPLNECNRNCQVSHLEVSSESYAQQCKVSAEIESVEGYKVFMDKNWPCRASQISEWLKRHPEYAAFGIFDDNDEHLSVNFEEKFISTEHNGIPILTLEDAEKAYQVVMKQLGFV